MNISELRQAITVEVPPGTYFLGDPCYAVSHDTWDRVCASNDAFTASPIATLPNGSLIGFSTAHGDGGYPGSDGTTFGVDAGMIGLVPESLWEVPRERLEELGTVVTFDRITLSRTDGVGRLAFGIIEIDTFDA